ncbi:MAG: acyltransferase [Lachnospiraceae bacterium]|nr:acyltransferase [Lachnospiraceae bacterium]
MTSYYSEEELKDLGLAEYGEDVRISRKCSMYSSEKIKLGNHVRIDDFCILSGNIVIHDYVHISAYTSLFAGHSKIEVGSYCALSSRCAVYAESDDYSGDSMVNPLVPAQFRHIQSEEVNIGNHVIVGTGGTILPGVSVGEGASVGAMSLIIRDIEPWTINVGIPCKKIKERSRKLLEYEQEWMKEIH